MVTGVTRLDWRSGVLARSTRNCMSAPTPPLFGIHAAAEVQNILFIKKARGAGFRFISKTLLNMALAAQSTNACAAVPSVLS